jgi:hypothetical protein
MRKVLKGLFSSTAKPTLDEEKTKDFPHRSRALRGCELRNLVFSVTTKFLAKDKREFTT